MYALLMSVYVSFILLGILFAFYMIHVLKKANTRQFVRLMLIFEVHSILTVIDKWKTSVVLG